MNVDQFVIANLPPSPARVLEVGCGQGELAKALADQGYEITAIDPDAPEGPIFRKTSLEEFCDEVSFDAVVASRSMHHIPDFQLGIQRIHALLRQGGLLIINEFAWDRMDERTAHWYLSQVPESLPKDESLLPGNFPHAWIAEHNGLHDSNTMRRTLDTLFRPKEFEWVPYIAEYYLDRPDLIAEERRSIESGAINALGFHYVAVKD